MDDVQSLPGATLDILRRIIAISPFAVLTGTEVVACADGFAEIAMPFDARLTQHHGYLHGGLIGYLADTAISFAAASVAGDVLTAEYRVHMLAPGKHARFVARGQILKAGRRQIVARADVFGVDGENDVLIATATGTVMPVAPR